MTTTLAPHAVAPVAAPPARRRPRVPWSLAALLVGTAALYLWGLSASGWANEFYAAAVQAGAADWKAFFFGSLDAGNFITVDKPPASLWVMALSVRIFGFSAWSLLVPQALEGVAAVALLYAAVRRWAGHVPGLVAGAILALTPAAALMFRFDNPDALLVLLMVAAAYAVVRAVERASTRWLVLAGVAIGFAFLTKMLQGFLVLPAFVLVYLVAAPTTLRRRLLQLLAAAAAVVVSAGWWVAIVELWPASSRPYIGGSTDNSVMDLVLGYNGLARILGGQGNGPAGGGGVQSSAFGGATGLGRLFSDEMAYEISWLLPAALVALVAGLWLTWGRPRTDRTRAGLLLWSGWLVVTGLVFSFMAGVVHPYYTVALAPAVGALVAIGGGALWQARERPVARVGLALMVVAAAGWSAVLLDGASAMTWLAPVVGALGVMAGVALLVVDRSTPRAVAAAVLGAAPIAGMTGSAASAVTTAASPHSGSIPTVGLSPSDGGFGGGGVGGPEGLGGPGGQAPSAGGGFGAPPAGGPGVAGSGTGAGTGATGTTTGSTSDLTTLLSSTGSRWSAAVVGDQSAARLELDSGTAVMAIGGWSGSDPAPTLAQFQEYVASGQVTYYLAGGQGGGRGGSDNEIATWVEQSFTATTVGSWTVYDLTS